MQSGAWLPSSYHLNKVEIFSSRVSHNYKYLSAIDKQVSIAPVLKSNAYGHNIVTMAKILELLSPPFLCVYSLPEAFELLKANIKIPILIFGHINAKHLIGKKLPFSYAVYDTSLLQVINKYQPSAGVHIFVDTGMHREGISLEKLSNFIIQIKKYKNIKIEGLMSHFASGDKPNHVLTKKQIHNFLKAQEICKQLKVTPKWIHIGASTAMMHYKNYIGKIGNMARVGIALYGIDPENKNNQLKPVLRLTTTLSQIKTLSKGERVGYDFTFTAKKNMKLGVLPIGYYDGINRKLSNKGFVYLNNTKCPIIGRVSMNITTVDISKVKYPKIGQKVIIFSNEKNKENVISKIAVTSKTIPYEILVNLAASIERVVL